MIEIDLNKIKKNELATLLIGKDKEIKRLKEEYIILQNASDEVEEELQQRIDKAIHRIQLIQMDGEVSIKDLTELVNILKGSGKE